MNESNLFQRFWVVFKLHFDEFFRNYFDGCLIIIDKYYNYFLDQISSNVKELVKSFIHLFIACLIDFGSVGLESGIMNESFRNQTRIIRNSF